LLSKEERQRQDELANADRQRLMDLLGVREAKDLPPEESDPNRPAGLTRPANNPNGWTDVAGRFVVRSPWGNWINYDLAKAAAGPLPDPLRLADGAPVPDAATWWSRRRPELVAAAVGRAPAGKIAVAPQIIVAVEPELDDASAAPRRDDDGDSAVGQLDASLAVVGHIAHGAAVGAAARKKRADQRRSHFTSVDGKPLRKIVPRGNPVLQGNHGRRRTGRRGASPLRPVHSEDREDTRTP